MNKRRIIGIISIISIIAIGALPINIIYKIILISFILGIDFFLNRALIFFIQGNRNILNKKANTTDKAWEYYRKAFNTGKLDPKYLVTMGNVLAQRGDPNFSIEVLNQVLNNQKASTILKNQARVQKSMALERLDKIEEAIDILQIARKNGYKDKSLYINLGCYLLFNDNILEANEVLDESIDYEATNAGSFDNRGWLYIVKEEWEKASNLYSEMMDRNPNFPDPYVHAAQVKLHYGNKKDAIYLLNQAITKKWNSASFFNQEILKTMLKNLEKKDNELYIAKFNLSYIEIAKGLDLKDFSTEILLKYSKIPFEKDPNELNQTKEEEIESQDKPINQEKGESNLPNTDLNEDDLEWEKNHSL